MANDVDIVIRISEAAAYGLVGGLAIETIRHDIIANKEANRHSYDGRTWSFLTARDLESLFPFVSRSTWKRALVRLAKEGVLIISFFGARCYAFADEERFIAPYLENPKPQKPNGRTATTPDSQTIRAFLDAYNSVAEVRGWVIRRTLKLPSTDLHNLRRYIAERAGTPEKFQRLLQDATSSFLCGEGPSGWRADFSWAIRPATIVKLIDRAWAQEQGERN